MNKSPSKACKDAGLRGLQHLAELTGQTVQTLRSWHNMRPWVFDACLLKARIQIADERVAFELRKTDIAGLPLIAQKTGLSLDDLREISITKEWLWLAILEKLLGEQTDANA